MTFKDAIESSDRTLYAKMTASDLPIDDVNIEKVVFSSSLLTGASFEIGTSVAGSIVATLLDHDGLFSAYDFTGKEFKTELGIETNSVGPVIEYKTLGYFTVEELKRDGQYITLKASDRMYKFNKAYDDSGLTYPATLLTILQDACDQAGVDLITVSFANSTYEVSSMSFYGVTLRKIIESVAELAGGYAVINEDGDLEIITLDLNDLAPKTILMDHYYADGLVIGEVANTVIDNVAIKTGEVIAYAGSGLNLYTIANNIFAQTPDDLVAGVYAVLNGLSYASITLTWQGDFGQPIGKYCSIETDTDTLYAYLFNRVLTYDGGLSEVTKAPARSDVVKNNAVTGSTKVTIDQIVTEIRVMNGEIDLVVAETNDLSDEVASLQIQADSISATVSDHTGQISSIVQTVDGIETTINDVDADLQSLKTTFKETTDGFEITRTVNIGGSNEKTASIKSAFDANNEAYLSISDGGNDVAVIKSNNILIANGTFVNSVIVGVHKLTAYTNNGEDVTIVQKI